MPQTHLAAMLLFLPRRKIVLLCGTIGESCRLRQDTPLAVSAKVVWMTAALSLYASQVRTVQALLQIQSSQTAINKTNAVDDVTGDVPFSFWTKRAVRIDDPVGYPHCHVQHSKITAEKGYVHLYCPCGMITLWLCIQPLACSCQNTVGAWMDYVMADLLNDRHVHQCFPRAAIEASRDIL